MASELIATAELRIIVTVKQNHALAVLIDETRRANSWSDQDVADRATKTGHKLSKSNISRIRNSPVIALNIDTVSALADGLGIPKSIVVQAALAAMGIVMYDSGQLTADAAIKQDPTITAENKLHLLALLESMRDNRSSASSPQRVRQEEVVGNAEHPAPNTRAGESPAPRNKKPYTDEHAHPDADAAGNVALPGNYYELAADSSRNYGANEAARAGERGEETQENEQSN